MVYIIYSIVFVYYINVYSMYRTGHIFNKAYFNRNTCPTRLYAGPLMMLESVLLESNSLE